MAFFYPGGNLFPRPQKPMVFAGVKNLRFLTADKQYLFACPKKSLIFRKYAVFSNLLEIKDFQCPKHKAFEGPKKFIEFFEVEENLLEIF
ncbi:MAG: hypothetical protein ABFD07_18065 [Methanobacterium sp.]